MYFSNEFRSRNFAPSEKPRVKPGYLIFGCVGLLLVCCVCSGIAGVFYYANPNFKFPSFPTAAAASSAKPTATPDPNKPLPLRSKGLGENGIELTVLKFQRPLKVEGLIGAPAGQQYVLATLNLKNTKKTGAPINVDPVDFTIKGDGGLTYTANPKNITINNLLAPTPLAPGKEVEGELIYQIALNDSGLKLYWKAGNSSRIFVLEEEK